MFQEKKNLLNAESFLQSFYFFVFSFLDLNSLLSCQLVNRKWSIEVEKSYIKREQELYKSLMKGCSIDSSLLSPEEFTEIYHIISFHFQSTSLFTNSSLADRRLICEIMACCKPPEQLERIVTITSLFLIDHKEWKQINHWKLHYRSISIHCFGTALREKFESSKFLLSISKEKLETAQDYLKENPLDSGMLKKIMFKADYWALWVLKIIEIVQKRLNLREYTREILDDILQNFSPTIQQEINKIRKLTKQIQLRPVKKALRAKLESCFSQYNERLETLTKKTQERDFDVLTIKLAIKNLEYIVKDLEKENKKKPQK